MNSEVTETTGIMGNFTTTLAPLNDPTGATVLEHGVTILATGGHEYKPTEYLYGQHDERHDPSGFRACVMNRRCHGSRTPESAAFIQCVGSRNPNVPTAAGLLHPHRSKAPSI